MSPVAFKVDQSHFIVTASLARPTTDARDPHMVSGGASQCLTKLLPLLPFFGLLFRLEMPCRSDKQTAATSTLTPLAATAMLAIASSSSVVLQGSLCQLLSEFRHTRKRGRDQLKMLVQVQLLPCCTPV